VNPVTSTGRISVVTGVSANLELVDWISFVIQVTW